MRIVGLIAIITAFMVGIGSNLPIMIDPASLIIVLGGTLGMLLFGSSSIPTMFKTIFSGTATVEELQAGVKGWKMASAYSLASGGIGTIIGLVIMLKYMDDPAAIGPGIAIALLTTFYGIVLSLAIFLPLQSRLEDRVQERTAQS